jgi:hypothetical protein
LMLTLTCRSRLAGEPRVSSSIDSADAIGSPASRPLQRFCAYGAGRVDRVESHCEQIIAWLCRKTLSRGSGIHPNVTFCKYDLDARLLDALHAALGRVGVADGPRPKIA